MDSIVVTGASGFIGREVVRQLKLSKFDPIPVSRKNIAGHYELDHYSNTPAGDYLIHLAENPVQNAISKASHAVKENLETLDILIEKFGKNILYTSSSAVYGDQQSTPHSEGDPVFTKSPYSELKLACEQKILAAGGTVLRLCNVFGEAMSPSTVLIRIIQQLHKDGSLYLGSCRPMREFIAVEDVANAIALVCKTPTEGLFNLGTEQAVSIGKLASHCLAIVGSPNRKIVEENPNQLPSVIQMSSEKFRTHFQWQPKYTLENRLQQLIQHFSGQTCEQA